MPTWSQEPWWHKWLHSSGDPELSALCPATQSMHVHCRAPIHGSSIRFAVAIFTAPYPPEYSCRLYVTVVISNVAGNSVWTCEQVTVSMDCPCIMHAHLSLDVYTMHSHWADVPIPLHCHSASRLNISATADNITS